ncbi:Tyrosine-protein phosphatase non-receptor type 14 [Dissostichus eleginoides]|uniref:Tyrosine-protein phosphatase non-receptor type n=1 Tax=Dissostichus eleginoides TaxID=100907 RepID=A0AAD9BT91_DISEL|nr:Tyrosine-protein phosphatase non-receptor type 14 [Dissostichus eleginoides]
MLAQPSIVGGGPHIPPSRSAGADFGDFTQFMSQDFLREYVLFPVNWPNGDEVLEEWTQKVAKEHKSRCRMQTAEAELLYIKEVEKLDGFGQESFPAKDNYTNDIFIGVSFIGVFVKHRNGRSIMLHKWKDIGTIAHNKSAITVEITSKDDTIIFHMEDMEMAKYIARLFTARHKFYKQNKICAEPTHSPAQIRRRTTWTHRLSLPRPQSCNFQSMHSQYGEHYQDTQSSQDSIFHDEAYYKSETSLDRCPAEFPFRNGTVPNGSMYSSPSLSSLNHSQTFVPPSPMSSNLSIPGSELMRPDYIPSHRHSAIIAPSYRPTPEYDAVMRQKRRMLPAQHDLHSQSLRSLNISNACAYRQPEALVYSQPEMRERSPYHGLGPSPGPYAPQISYSKPVSHGPHQGGPATSQGPCHSPCLSVKTFQPDSSAVVHQSLQERHSMEVISSMRGGGGMDGMVMKGMNAPLHRRNTLREHVMPPQPQTPQQQPQTHPQQPQELPMQMPVQKASEVSVAPPESVAYQHQKTLSNATMLIHKPDLTSVKERVRKEPVKERPVSEMFSLEDSIVEREIAQRTLERQKMSVDSMKRPLMMAALNGLYVARMPVPESPAEEGAKAATDERCKTLELKLEEERVFTEYEQVPKKRTDCVLTTATLPENTERNRFRDVVPYEENRVELVPNKENNTGYINASHIKVMIRGEEWHYIATQGPLANTCADFWQMVWEQGVNVIAMVTAEEEGGRPKSHRYWPKLGSKHNSATHGKFKVTTKFRTDSGCYATTGLKVKHLLSGQERTVWHLQYTDWPEQGCPEYVQGFLSYLEEIQSVRRHTNSMLDTSKSLNPPVVVHCSAGVGRTGVVILTELMISCLEHNEPVEVPTMLSELRQQRMLMVQTISQYKFVYQVLIQFLKNSRLI